MHPLLDEYAGYHRDPRNRVMHEIGIPLIVLGIAALLRCASEGLEIAVIVATSLYYARLAGVHAVPAIVGLIAIWVLSGFVSWQWAIALFLLGWVFQFIGHAYEGKKPAFLKNLLHLLVGPLWIGVILTQRRA